MSVKLNASTSSGLVVDSDLTGSLKLQTGGNDALTVDSSQVVNFAKQFQIGGVLPPAFSAYSSTDQTGVLSGVSTKVLFATEEFDTNSNYASSRFTPTVAGYYQITARTDWSITSGACFISIYKNGSAYKGGALNGATGSGTGPTVTGLVYCNGSTDYIEIYAYQNNGTNTIFGSSNSSYTYFQGAMVRAS